MFADYLLALLFSHLVGNFIFQNNYLPKKKGNSQENILALFIHAGIFFVTNVVVFLCFFKKVPWAVLFWLGLIHWVVDLTKANITLEYEDKAIPLFFGDQAIHLLSILVAANFLHPLELNYYASFFYHLLNGKVVIANSLTLTKKVLLVLIYICLTTSVANTVIRILVGGSRKDFGRATVSGRYIGIVERILTIAIVLTGAWQALAVLYGPKTAIRFEKAKKNPNFAEYYILGTSLSALFAVFIAIAIRLTLMG